MKILLVLPLLVPLVSAALSLVFWRRTSVQRVLGVASASGLFVISLFLLALVRRDGIQVVQMGGWSAPFGITFVADLFSAIMVVLAGAMGLAVTVSSLFGIDERREAFGYYPLLQVLLMGVCGAFLTGDIFNLYVWFEVMLMSSFVLLALGGERRQMKGAIKYVTINLLSSAIFLAAIGLLYGITGTLNMADLSVKLGALPPSGMPATLSVLFIIAFGVKAALFPLYFWLPASYHTPPFPVSAIFAGLLTKVGVYSLVRIFTLVFVTEARDVLQLILVLAGLTMLAGGLGAIVQHDVRRLLSFLIISHIGVAVMGLGLYTERALAGMIFYLIEDITVFTNLFLISGVIGKLCGTYNLERAGGLYKTYPAFAVLFLIPALSLSGFPPFSGFFAKLALVQAGLAQGSYTIVCLSLIVSLLSLIAVMRIWSEAFWKPQDETTAIRGTGECDVKEMLDIVHPVAKLETQIQVLPLLVPIAALSFVNVAIGIGSGYIFDLSLEAAGQVINPAGYVRAVLGGGQ